MGYPNGQVDIPGLAKVGGNVTHAAESVGKAFGAHADAVAPGSTLAGWTTGAVLPGATEAWATFVKDLAARVSTFGGDLTAASKEYQATDAAAAARTNQAGAGIPAGHPAWGNVYGQQPR